MSGFQHDGVVGNNNWQIVNLNPSFRCLKEIFHIYFDEKMFVWKDNK